MRGYRRKRSKPFPARKPDTSIRLKKIPSFTRRHARELSLIGSFVVLGTFAVREIIEQDLRARIDSVNELLQEFSTPDQRDVTVGETDRIINGIETPTVPAQLGDNKVPLSVYVKPLILISSEVSDLDIRGQGLDDGTRTLINSLRLWGNPTVGSTSVGDLKRELGEDPKDTKDIIGLRLGPSESTKDALNELRVEGSRLVCGKSDCSDDSDVDNLLSDGSRIQLVQLRNGYKDLYRRVQFDYYFCLIRRHVALVFAEINRKSLSTLNQASIFVGYVLYAIGWSLNVVGTWFGLKISSSEE